MKAQQDMESALREVGRYDYRQEVHPVELDASLLSSEYEAWLQNRLEELGISVPKYPDVSHEQVLSRSFEGRRPFKGDKDKDRGYKDSLIWETVLEVSR